MKSLEFEYECGEFETSTDKKVSFIRVSNFTDVLVQSVKELKESCQLIHQSNIPDNVLWTLFTGDKGGKSTKLLLQILNCKEQHSVMSAHLLAIFEGDKDNYECLEKVFKPIIDEAIKVLSDIDVDLCGFLLSGDRVHETQAVAPCPILLTKLTMSSIYSFPIFT